MDNIIKRLEIQKNYGLLEEDEDIEERRQLQIYRFQQQIDEIITTLEPSVFGVRSIFSL